MKNIILWFKIIRPHTLFASFCPVLVGLMAEGVSSWDVAAVTLLCALSLQILSNLINDYYDFRRGSDKAGRVGPSRALAEGKVTEVQMLRAVFVTLVLCLVSGLYLVFRGGWPILLIGLASLLFAWLYTASRCRIWALQMSSCSCSMVWLQVPEPPTCRCTAFRGRHSMPARCAASFQCAC